MVSSLVPERIREITEKSKLARMIERLSETEKVKAITELKVHISDLKKKNLDIEKNPIEKIKFRRIKFRALKHIGFCTF
jgi:hypothetical protein